MPRGVPGPVKKTPSREAKRVADRYIDRLPSDEAADPESYEFSGEPESVKKTDSKARGELFKEGGKGGPGRPKGSLNKFSGEVKQIILDGLHSAHPEGLGHWVMELAKDSPTSAAALLGRLIPVSTDVKMDLKHEVTFKFD